MTLTNVIGNNKYCGPAVVAAIAGITTDEAERCFKTIRGRYTSVTGVRTSEIVLVLELLGYKVSDISKTTDGKTIFNVLISGNLSDGVYIFAVKAHVVILQKESSNWFFLDNHTKRPINAGAAARLGQKVMLTLKVEHNANKTK